MRGSTILPADAPSAWGLNPDAVFGDELANWHDGPSARRLWEARPRRVAKSDDAEADSPDHSRLARSLRAQDPRPREDARRSWRVHEVAGPAPWADPERLAEQRQRLPDAVYRTAFRERMDGGGRIVPRPRRDRRRLHAGRPERRPARAPIRVASRFSYAAALDLGSRQRSDRVRDRPPRRRGRLPRPAAKPGRAAAPARSTSRRSSTSSSRRIGASASACGSIRGKDSTSRSGFARRPGPGRGVRLHAGIEAAARADACCTRSTPATCASTRPRDCARSCSRCAAPVGERAHGPSTTPRRSRRPCRRAKR